MLTLSLYLKGSSPFFLRSYFFAFHCYFWGEVNTGVPVRGIQGRIRLEREPVFASSSRGGEIRYLASLISWRL